MKTNWAILGLVIILVGCQTVSSGPQGTTAFEKEGWKPFSSPRTGDAPGRIYRVEPSGRVFEVTQVTGSPRVDEHELYEVSSTAEFTLGEVLKTMGLAEEALPVNVKSNLDRKNGVFTKSSSARREFLEDRDITDQAVANALAGITIRDNNRYYLIRETLSSKNLNFKINKGWLVDLGVDADIKKAIENKTNVTWKDGSEVSLDKTFDSYYRVWYKPEKLVIEGSLGVGPNQPPVIKRIPNATEFKLPETVQNVP